MRERSPSLMTVPRATLLLAVLASSTLPAQSSQETGTALRRAWPALDELLRQQPDLLDQVKRAIPVALREVEPHLRGLEADAELPLRRALRNFLTGSPFLGEALRRSHLVWASATAQGDSSGIRDDHLSLRFRGVPSMSPNAHGGLSTDILQLHRLHNNAEGFLRSCRRMLDLCALDTGSYLRTLGIEAPPQLNVELLGERMQERKEETIPVSRLMDFLVATEACHHRLATVTETGRKEYRELVVPLREASLLTIRYFLQNQVAQILLQRARQRDPLVHELLQGIAQHAGGRIPFIAQFQPVFSTAGPEGDTVAEIGCFESFFLLPMDSRARGQRSWAEAVLESGITPRPQPTHPLVQTYAALVRSLTQPDAQRQWERLLQLQAGIRTGRLLGVQSSGVLLTPPLEDRPIVGEAQEGEIAAAVTLLRPDLLPTRLAFLDIPFDMDSSEIQRAQRRIVRELSISLERPHVLSALRDLEDIPQARGNLQVERARHHLRDLATLLQSLRTSTLAADPKFRDAPLFRWFRGDTLPSNAPLQGEGTGPALSVLARRERAWSAYGVRGWPHGDDQRLQAAAAVSSAVGSVLGRYMEPVGMKAHELAKLPPIAAELSTELLYTKLCLRRIAGGEGMDRSEIGKHLDTLAVSRKLHRPETVGMVQEIDAGLDSSAELKAEMRLLLADSSRAVSSNVQNRLVDLLEERLQGLERAVRQEASEAKGAEAFLAYLDAHAVTEVMLERYIQAVDPALATLLGQAEVGLQDRLALTPEVGMLMHLVWDPRVPGALEVLYDVRRNGSLASAGDVSALEALLALLTTAPEPKGGMQRKR